MKRYISDISVYIYADWYPSRLYLVYQKYSLKYQYRENITNNYIKIYV